MIRGWLVRAWRYRIEIRPVPMLLSAVGWISIGRLLTASLVRTLQLVCLVVIVACLIVLAWLVMDGQVRRLRARRRRRPSNH